MLVSLLAGSVSRRILTGTAGVVLLPRLLPRLAGSVSQRIIIGDDKGTEEDEVEAEDEECLGRT